MANPYDQFDANPYDQFDLPATPEAPSLGQQVLRQGKLAGRAVVNAAAELPLAALEGGAGVANILRRGTDAFTDPSGNFSFRTGWERDLNRATAEPQGLIEKGTQLATSALLGSKIPAPTVRNPAPAGFGAGATPGRIQALEQARPAGYVVPPATSNPTALNKILEGIAGKLTTAQLASAKNQNATNTLVKRALGLNEDAPLTLDAIQAVRREAGEAYRVIRSAGTVVADERFAADIANIGAKYRGAAKDFPELAKSEVDDLIRGLSQNADGTPKAEFDADSAVDLIAILRDKADKAFRTGDKGLGSAYKDATKALESVIERNLSGRGGAGKAILEQYRKAREAIAKTYTVEDAFNQTTGNVNAAQLASRLAKGKPLSGELRQVGQFGQAFPKAARDFNESLPGVSPLDFYATGGAAAITQQPWYLLYPFIRQGVRQALLSQAGQNALASPGGPLLGPASKMGGLNALVSVAGQE